MWRRMIAVFYSFRNRQENCGNVSRRALERASPTSAHVHQWQRFRGERSRARASSSARQSIAPRARIAPADMHVAPDDRRFLLVPEQARELRGTFRGARSTARAGARRNYIRAGASMPALPPTRLSREAPPCTVTSPIPAISAMSTRATPSGTTISAATSATDRTSRHKFAMSRCSG